MLKKTEGRQNERTEISKTESNIQIKTPKAGSWKILVKLTNSYKINQEKREDRTLEVNIVKYYYRYYKDLKRYYEQANIFPKIR